MHRHVMPIISWNEKEDTDPVQTYGKKYASAKKVLTYCVIVLLYSRRILKNLPVFSQ